MEVLLDQVAEKLHKWEGGERQSLDLSLMLGESGRVSQRASRLKGQWNLNSWAVIQSTRPRSGPWIIRFQHLVRRLTWWFPEPIIQQVRVFQQNTALTVDGLAQNQEGILTYAQEQELRISELQQRIDSLEARLSALEAE